MKKLVMFLTAFLVFLFIFFKSNTWQSYRIIEEKRGFEYVIIKHKLHWDRFFKYIKDIPKNVMESDFVKSLIAGK